ncbi:MAG: class I SAM-dependent methyltransferase [Nitrososphaerota archaeon]|nr:class I SAM-dependent methyltransferase [Nitrososphaerota archaeon]MDG6954633.1 class I SAM-dependent methyltransferase [Nitrososphaerota archaeon]
MTASCGGSTGTGVACPTCSEGDRRVPLFLMDNLVRRFASPPSKFVENHVAPGQVVADLGSGSGFYALPLARRVGASGKVFAVDFDEKAVKALSAKAQGLNLGAVVDPRVGSAAHLGFIPDASTDFVLASGLLCCMVDHEGAVDEIKRILKPSGTAYLSVTRAFRKSDPRAVSREEWHKILEGFKVLEGREGLASRWALVSRLDRGSSGTKGGTSAGGAG